MWSNTTSTSLTISAMSGSPIGSGLGSAERLDGAHQVVAEEADRAAGERRQLVQPAQPVTRPRYSLTAP